MSRNGGRYWVKYAVVSCTLVLGAVRDHTTDGGNRLSK